MFHTLTLGSLIVVLTGLTGTAEDTKSIDGDWVMTSFVQNGESQTPAEGRILRIEGDQFADREGETELAKGTLVLDQSRTPWTLDATFTEGGPEGKTVKAIVEKKDGKLRICAGEPGGDRPGRFETGTGAGAGAWLMEYRKKP